MHVVAIQRCGDVDEARVRRLAEITRVPPLAARARLAGRGPKVVATAVRRADAERLCAALAAGGFDPLRVDAAEERSRRGRVSPRSFTVAPDGLWGLLGDGTSWTFRFEDVRLLVHASRFERIVLERQDLAPFKQEVATWDAPLSPPHVDVKEEGAPFLRVFVTGAPDLVLAQKDLSYEGLGDAMTASRGGNFLALAELLRGRCVHARLDDRLLTPRGQRETLGGLLDPHRFLDVAVGLLSRAEGARSGPYR